MFYYRLQTFCATVAKCVCFPLLVFIFAANIMRASLARVSRSALVELISLAIPLLVVINLPGVAESRARLLTHINRWHKVACIPENLKVCN